VGLCPLFLFQGSLVVPEVRAPVQTEAAVARIRPIAERVALSHGVELFEVQFRREPVGWVLRVIIDRPPRRDANGVIQVEAVEDAIGIVECQRISEDLSAVLDVEDVVEPHYTLEVSSPGLDRPLRGADDYGRFAGRLAKIVLHEPIDGQTHFEGRLGGVEAERVVLAVGKNKEKRVPLSSIARARLEVEF
jgi:ribosome maturation factor RimP